MESWWIKPWLANSFFLQRFQDKIFRVLESVVLVKKNRGKIEGVGVILGFTHNKNGVLILGLCIKV